MKQYYVIRPSQSQQGPLDEAFVREQYEKGIYEPHTQVWTEGMTNWALISTVFADCARSVPPPYTGHTTAPNNALSNGLDNLVGNFVYICQNIFNYKGRTSRKEYWMGVLALGILYILYIVMWSLLLVPFDLSEHKLETASLVLELPLDIFYILMSCSMGCRRLHDVGRSGWEQLIGLIPILGWIVLIIWCCTKGQKNANQYGPAPLS